MTASPKLAEDHAPQIKTVRVEGRWKGRYRNDLAVRDFNFVTAEPEKIGGNNEGPTPMEYVAGALSGCLGIVIELVAKEQGVALDDLCIECTGLVDQRGLFGTAEVSPHFQSVDIAITLATRAPEAQLAALKRDVLKRCPVYNLVRDSGAKVTVTWTVAEATR
ncbi:MAG TPA: OsmC family protein [Alphaproteobacteria bacterium]|nr:OsmC family protein [Alphaproteobacteria bacterium]